MRLTSILLSSLLVVGLVGLTGCEDPAVRTDPVAPDAQPARETAPPADPTVTDPGMTDPATTPPPQDPGMTEPPPPPPPADPQPGTGDPGTGTDMPR